MLEVVCIGLLVLLTAASLRLIAACAALGGEKP
jgi:hypothetical protein